MLSYSNYYIGCYKFSFLKASQNGCFICCWLTWLVSWGHSCRCEPTNGTVSFTLSLGHKPHPHEVPSSGPALCENRDQSSPLAFGKKFKCYHSSNIFSFLLVPRCPAPPYAYDTITQDNPLQFWPWVLHVVSTSPILRLTSTCNRLILLQYIFLVFLTALLEQKIPLKWLEQIKMCIFFFFFLWRRPNIGLT